MKDHTNAIYAHALLPLVAIYAHIIAACIGSNCKISLQNTWVLEPTPCNALSVVVGLWTSSLSNSICKCISTCIVSSSKVIFSLLLILISYVSRSTPWTMFFLAYIIIFAWQTIGLRVENFRPLFELDNFGLAG